MTGRYNTWLWSSEGCLVGGHPHQIPGFLPMQTYLSSISGRLMRHTRYSTTYNGKYALRAGSAASFLARSIKSWKSSTLIPSIRVKGNSAKLSRACCIISLLAFPIRCSRASVSHSVSPLLSQWNSRQVTKEPSLHSLSQYVSE